MSMEYGLIGKSLCHSFSPEIHRLFGDYEYGLFELAPDELDGFFRRRDFHGINVTVPYKEAVLKYLDEVSTEAAEIGAVNTIINRNGRLCGYNTDFFGLCALVEHEKISLEHRSVLILGTGGTSKTAAAVCRHFNAKSVLKVSRTPKNGEISYEEAAKMPQTEVVINTTPVGMYPDTEEIPIDVSMFPNLCGAVDAIYNPLRTSFVLKAGETSTAAGGLYMLVAQAAAAAELFTGRSIPQEKIEHAYKTVLRQKENIVLIGMPTAGKSTVGRIIAEKLGKSFFDSDELAAALEGKSIPGIFAEGGENAFRKIEHRAIALLSKQRGAVIATGGGAVLREENMAALRKNGRLYYLERPLEALSADENHPLSQTAEQLAALFTARKPLYEKYCDTKITVTGGAEETAAAVLEDFLK